MEKVQKVGQRRRTRETLHKAQRCHPNNQQQIKEDRRKRQQGQRVPQIHPRRMITRAANISETTELAITNTSNRRNYHHTITIIKKTQKEHSKAKTRKQKPNNQSNQPQKRNHQSSQHLKDEISRTHQKQQQSHHKQKRTPKQNSKAKSTSESNSPIIMSI